MDQRSSISTIFISIWAACTAVWSIFTPPQLTFPARLILFQPLWFVRIWRSDSSWVQDLALALVLHSMYTFCMGSWKFFGLRDLRTFRLDHELLWIYSQVFALLGTCGLFAGMIVFRGSQLRTADDKDSRTTEVIDEALLPPLLIPSRTKHTRLFPQKHSFSYSYLFVGIPVGLKGRIGNVLSVDHSSRGWFHIRSEDYLQRGTHHLTLGEKLKQYLHTQGVTDREYAFAYLVTAPRFLDYGFNPVSFWYLYDSDTELKYMILEVNNTFDERRMYLLETCKSDESISSPDDGDHLQMISFSRSFAKDFHVSPFNSRKGSYSLKATDPFASCQGAGEFKIDNNIVLRSSNGPSKLVARVWSTGPPKEAASMSNLELAKFIASWWWVTFATMPRILWEAQALYRKRLRLFHRPEVTEQSIGRTYTEDERVLERYFRAYLTHIVKHVKKPFRIVYKPAHSEDQDVILYSSGFTYEQDHRRSLTLKVLSPAFYSRFVHYAHAKEAFDRECLATDEKNRTLVIESPDLLPVLFDAVKAENEIVKNTRNRSFISRVLWGLLRRLRCPPAVASYPSDSSRLDYEYNVQDIRSFHLSELDRFVQVRLKGGETYRRIVTKLFLSERVAFGVPALIVVYDIILRSLLLLSAMIYANSSKTFDIFRPQDISREIVWDTALSFLIANMVHLWSFS